MVSIGDTAAEKRRRLLAQRLADRQAAIKGEIPKDLSTFGTLSFSEERLCFLNDLEGPSSTYTVAAAIRIEGLLDVARLEWCFDELCHRHSVFRSCYRFEGNDYRRFEAENHKDFGVLDAAVLGASVQTFLRQQAALPFDFNRGPLLRVRVIREADDSWVLFLGVHHVIADGHSVGLLFEELSELYGDEAAAARTSEARPEVAYDQYAAWARERLQGARLDQLLAYWAHELAGIDQTLDLPFDRPRGEGRGGEVAAVRFTWDAQRRQRVHEVAQESGTTSFVVLLTLYEVLLAHLAKQRSFAVGIPVANRPLRQLERVIGAFVNTVPIPVSFDETTTFRDALQAARRAVIGAVDHDELPFERLVEELRPVRHARKNPLFQAWFVMHGRSVQDFSLPGLTITTLDGNQDLTMTDIELRAGAAKFDCSLSIEENRAGYVGLVEYPRDLFEEATIRGFIDSLHEIADALLADPTRLISDWSRPAHDDGTTAPASGGTRRRIPQGDPTPTRCEIPVGPRGSLAYWEWGSSGPLCLLIHGLGHHGRAWDEVARPLVALGARVLAPDLSGHGGSSWATNGRYSVDLWATSVVELATSAGISRPSVLVGHSIGAHVAAAAGDSLRRVLEGMVLIDIPLDAVPRGSHRDMSPAGRRYLSVNDYVDALASTHPLGKATVLSRLAEHGSNPVPGMGIERTDDPALYESFPFSDPLDDLRFLRAIRVPTLVVRGAVSGRLSRPTAERLAREILKDGTVATVDGAGHGAHVDAPEAVAACVAEFVRTILAGDGTALQASPESLPAVDVESVG